jgi:HSP20 family molecular chaperone IbpA
MGLFSSKSENVPVKRSFFEKLTGGVHVSDEDADEVTTKGKHTSVHDEESDVAEDTDGELALDVYQTPSDIIVQTFVAGVKPEDLEINITRDMITIRGKRQESHKVQKDDFFSQELYWGSFSRTVSLPQEVEPDEAEAIERHGLLTIRLPKIDKNKKSNLKVKSV